MKHGRRDKNHALIRDGLRERYGDQITVHDCGDVGGDFPDLVAGYKGINYLFEVKSANGNLSKGQIEWHSTWKGSVYVIRHLFQAVAILETGNDKAFNRIY